MKLTRFLLTLILLLILTGCGNDYEKDGLTSQSEDRYHLYQVGDEDISESLWEAGVRNLYSYSIAESQDRAEENFPYLKIDTLPSYFVFDSKDLVYETNDIEELKKFLLENNPQE
ncbi:hypothetical protein [Jeotgalibacillus terrae]|uniref:Lipoprotein n=1 Tax=Jeotgalibacillus terrae TaxID=587735 RepID=A0ABW5ZKG7_9BACL|nr:hypothetical protein [Jeotgalibacillus terrae]MBM7578184.1 hypothetical protein [Jeotgalibacillus terrae]